MTSSARQLSTAGERREQVLEAAMRVFAERGYTATATAEVARQAGISQAYLFKLFPKKGDLLVAVVERCYARTYDLFAAAADRARVAGEEILPAMGQAYIDLLNDREALLGQLQSNAAAASDPAVRAAVQAGFARLYDLVTTASGAPEEDVRAFFATGMLLNVLVAMGAHELDADWAQALLGRPADS